jgi:hypothetical protein
MFITNFCGSNPYLKELIAQYQQNQEITVKLIYHVAPFGTSPLNIKQKKRQLY